MGTETERLCELIADLPGVDGTGIVESPIRCWPVVWFSVDPTVEGYSSLGIVAKAYVDVGKMPRGAELRLLPPIVVRFSIESHSSDSEPSRSIVEVDCYGEEDIARQLATCLENCIEEAANVYQPRSTM